MMENYWGQPALSVACPLLSCPTQQELAYGYTPTPTLHLQATFVLLLYLPDRLVVHTGQYPITFGYGGMTSSNDFLYLSARRCPAVGETHRPT